MLGKFLANILPNEWLILLRIASAAAVGLVQWAAAVIFAALTRTPMGQSITHTIVCLLLAIFSIVERSLPCVDEPTHGTLPAAAHAAEGDCAAADEQEGESRHGSSHTDACDHCFCSCPCHIPALQPTVHVSDSPHPVSPLFLSYIETPSDGVADNPDHVPLS